MGNIEILGLILVVLVGLVIYLLRRRNQTQGRPSAKRKNYAEYTSIEDKYTAVDFASSPKDLEAMWEEWSKRGYSEDGLLRATMLEKKRDLGAKLTAAEERKIRAAAKAKKRAEDLPTITGRRPAQS